MIGGQAAKANLDRLVRLPSYQLMTDEARLRLLKKAIREGRESARRMMEVAPRGPLPGVPSWTVGAIRG